MYFLDVNQHKMDPRLSKMKGYQYNYLVPLEAQKNAKLQEMTIMGNVNQFMADNQMHKMDLIRYPNATRRICGVSTPSISLPRLSKLALLFSENVARRA